MIDIRIIQGLSKKEDTVGVSLEQRALKLGEEAGEMNAAILARLGCANRSASAEDNILEETVDVLINCFDILTHLGFEADAIQAMMDNKCRKWARKLYKNG